MFYQEILTKVLNNLSSNFEIQDYRKKINRFVKSKALLQLFDENKDMADNVRYYMCLIRDEKFNYYFVLLDKNFNYRCHTNIYDTVYNYIKFDEYVLYNQETNFNITEDMMDEIKDGLVSKFNIVLLNGNHFNDKVLLVKLQSGNYLFCINDIIKFKILKYQKYEKYQ